MKKLTILIIFFVISQVTYSQRFTGGLTAGIVGSQVDGDTYSGYDKAGITAGGYINLKFREIYAIQMELEYMMKGSRHISNPDKGDNTTYKLNVNYISLPIIFQYKFYKSLVADFGIAASVLVSHKETANDVELGGSTYPGFSSQNLSGILGLSYEINDTWRVGIRSDNSIFSFRTKPSSGIYPSGYIKRFWLNSYGQFHNDIVISAFYRL